MWYIITKYPFKYFHWNTQELTDFYFGVFIFAAYTCNKITVLINFQQWHCCQNPTPFQKDKRLAYIFNNPLRFTCHLINDKSQLKKQIKKPKGFYFQSLCPYHWGDGIRGMPVAFITLKPWQLQALFFYMLAKYILNCLYPSAILAHFQCLFSCLIYLQTCRLPL